LKEALPPTKEVIYICNEKNTSREAPQLSLATKEIRVVTRENPYNQFREAPQPALPSKEVIYITRESPYIQVRETQPPPPHPQPKEIVYVHTSKPSRQSEDIVYVPKEKYNIQFKEAPPRAKEIIYVARDQPHAQVKEPLKPKEPVDERKPYFQLPSSEIMAEKKSNFRLRGPSSTSRPEKEVNIAF
jgi:hypothetical protein